MKKKKNFFVMFYIVLRIELMFFMQRYGLLQAKKSKDVFKIGTAERKILITFCYYVLLAVVDLTSFTIATRNSELFVEELFNYFTCEQNGNNPNSPCDTNNFRRLSTPWLTIVSLFLINLVPVVHLVYVVKINELKKKFMNCVKMKKPKPSATAQTNYSLGMILD